MADCSLESGTAQRLDPFGQTPRVEIALDPQALGDGERVAGRRMLDLPAAPKRHRPVLGEGAPVEMFDFGALFWLVHAASMPEIRP